jgi:hypothetical protein
MNNFKRKIIIPISTFALLSAITVPVSAEETERVVQFQSNQELTTIDNIDNSTVELNGYVAKTVMVDGVEVTISGKEEDMAEGSLYYEEALATALSSMTSEQNDLIIDSGLSDNSITPMTVPDQGGTYPISDYHYNSFATGALWDGVSLSIATAAGLIALSLSSSLKQDNLTSGAVAIGAAAVATLVTTTSKPDYTRSYYIKSWSSYYNMYTYQMVTQVYEDSSRADWSLIGHKLSGPLKKVDNVFMAL